MLRALVDVAISHYQVPAEFVVRSGDPYNEITSLAEELRVDEVVVGAWLKLGHRLVGSLAVHLIRAGRWPITVVP